MTEENPFYFRQLLSGRDFAKSDVPAQQMANFVYLLGDKNTKECMVIDPAYDIDDLLGIVEADGMKLTGALVTHYHPDHVGGHIFGMDIKGLPDLMEKNPVPVYVNKHEAEGLKKVTGVSDIDLNIVDSGDHLAIGENDIEFLHTPGHTPGSQCFKVNNNLVSGDTLFVQGCGRVDLPGSNSEDMFHSLRKLSSLPDETILYPGHHYSPQESETMGKVKEINSYLRIEELELWKQIM